MILPGKSGSTLPAFTSGKNSDGDKSSNSKDAVSKRKQQKNDTTFHDEDSVSKRKQLKNDTSFRDQSGRPRQHSDILSRKEIQLVQAVALVSGLYALSVLIMSLIALAEVVEPDFNTWRGKYQPLNVISICVSYTYSHINAGVSVLVYFKFNSRFRTTFLQLFAKKNPTMTSQTNSATE